MPLLQQPYHNRLIDSLAEADRNLLLSRCHPVALPLDTLLYESERTPSHAFFITSGMASVVTSMSDGGTVEVGVVGSEGVIGSLHLLGPTVISTRCMMQLAGSALSIRFSQLASLFEQHAGIRARLLEFVQCQAASLGQIAACHRLHLAEERLARWLLMVQDRIASDQLDLTQEFLAEMLGSRRTTVTKAAGTLEQAGAIEFKRGRIHILDRERLIAVTCTCYPVVDALYHRLYGRADTDVTPSLLKKLAM